MSSRDEQHKIDRALARLAIKKEILSEEQANSALRKQKKIFAHGEWKRLGAILEEEGWLDSDEVDALLAVVEQSGGAGAAASRRGLVGQEIGGCRIERKVGRGGMGTVYEAHQLSLDRKVAVKILPEAVSDDRKYILRFEREAKTIAALSHTNIVRVYDMGMDPSGPYYIVMEFVEGEALSKKKRRPLPEKEALRYVAEAAEGLAAAHAKGILHRDIKPDNLLLDRFGAVKIVDFGLARVTGDGAQLTRAGAMMGTPAYMSPEQGTGKKVDSRSDMYSLGATLYTLLTGRFPYEGETTVAIVWKHANDPVPRVREQVPHVSKETEALIGRAMAKNPAQRFRDMTEFAEIARAIIAGEPVEIGPVPDAARAGARPSGRTSSQRMRSAKGSNPLVWAGIAGLILVVGIVSWLVLQPKGEEAKPAEAVRRETGKEKRPRRPEPGPPEEAKPPDRYGDRVEALLNDIRALKSRGDLKEALEKVNALLMVYPDVEEAKRLREALQSTVERLPESKPPPAGGEAGTREAEYRQWMGWGSEAEQAGDLLKASRHYEKASKLAPSGSDEALNKSLHCLYTYHLMQAGASNEDGDLTNALYHLEKAEQLAPEGDTKARDKAIQFRQDYHLEVARQAEKDGELDVAVRHLKKALEAKDAPALRKELDRLKKALKEARIRGEDLSEADRCVALAEKAERRKDWRKALDNYEKARSLGAEVEDEIRAVKKRIERLVKQAKTLRREALAKASEAIRRKKWLDAIEALDEFLKAWPDDEKANAMLAKAFAIMPKTHVIALDRRTRLKTVLIPAGNFLMGSLTGGEENSKEERPRHKVTLSTPFYMASTEVTVGQFVAFVRDTKYVTEAEKEGTVDTWSNGTWGRANGSWREPGCSQDADHPVVCVSWKDAKAFCRWAGEKAGKECRLPTEAEWEYAARAGCGGKWCFGDDPGTLGHYAWVSYLGTLEGTNPVGCKKPNGWGVFDMHGNAWEWCEDSPRDYDEKDRIDPWGEKWTQRPVRGGYFLSSPDSCRSASRSRWKPSLRYNGLGFRVVILPR